MDTETFLRIPKIRVGALIGKNGKTKAQLEKELDCTLKIDKEGGVEIKCKDALAVLKSRNIVTAIGRGFSPENALLLLDDAYLIHIINLQDILGKNERTMERFKARIIGTQGKIRERIEEATDTKIAIFGKTVSIIGKRDDIQVARQAIGMILEGAMHQTVFTILAKKSKGM